MIVAFDHVLGQTVEFSLPPDRLTPPDLRALAFLAFPDCNTSSASMTAYFTQCYFLCYTGKTYFHARIKSSDPVSRGFLFASVCFHQAVDPTTPRGFSQRVSCHIITASFMSYIASPSRLWLSRSVHFPLSLAILRRSSETRTLAKVTRLLILVGRVLVTISS